jgi:hypothetical protein
VKTLVDAAPDDNPVATGCISDVECPAACEESTGKCVDAARVLWVSASGDDSGQCMKLAPCATLTRALELADPTRDFIRVENGDYHRALTVTKPVTISGTSAATPARITRDTLGTTIQVSGPGALSLETVRLVSPPGTGISTVANTKLSLFGVHVEGASGAGVVSYGATSVAQSVFEGNGRGIEAQQGTLVVSRSFFTQNQDWAIRVNGATYTITNSLFLENARGLLVDNTNQATSTISYCTFANTKNDDTIRCQGFSLGAAAVSNSIFSNNQRSLDPRCSATYSLFSNEVVSGQGNITGTPNFVSPTDFHLTATSPAIDAADPASTESIDYDGMMRPRGSGRDMGAYER